MASWVPTPLWPILWLAAIAFLLTGCAGEMQREPLSEKPRVAKLNSLAMPEKAIGLEGAGDDKGDDVISTNGRPMFVPTALDASDPLPVYLVPWMSFANSPLQDVLQSIVVDAHIPLSIAWESPAAKISRSSVSMTNLSGDLKVVLNKLAEGYGFYWRYKDGMLHIATDRQYITAVPPIADLYESLPIMVKTLGGTDVFLDKSARLITFRAGSQSFSKIKSYLEITRKDRSLIVYDTYIWEVVLNDASKMGIDWGALPGSVPATALSAGPRSALPSATNLLTAGLINAASGGTGLALSFAGSRFSMDILLDFLRSQGTINSLSQPKIQLLSGGKATLKDEIATTYVSRVGNPTISSGLLVPGSIETSQVKTGVSLEVTGDVSDGTVYSDIALRVSDLVGMGSATVSGSTISLPKTSSREVYTHVRAKPGDTILLAGIQYDKLNSNANTGMWLVRSNQAEVQRSELIIVMKPRIKHFVSKGDAEQVIAPPIAATTPAMVAAENNLKAPVSEPAADVRLPPGNFGPVAKAEIDRPRQERQPVPSSDEEKVFTLPTVTENNLKVPGGEPPPGVYLQLGAFGSVENAESFRLELERQLDWLRDAGQRLHLISSTQPNSTALHRVQAGPFPNRKTARKASERLREILGSPPALVIR